MDIRELRYFIAAYEEGSVTGAARRSFVSQPSVSAAIASLEAELGAVLFVRHKKGVSPTAAGEQLYPVARRIAGEELAARSLFKQPPRARRITLGLMRTLDIPRTLEIIAPLAREPDLHVRLVGADRACDARVVSEVMLAGGEQFLPLWVERYVVALPARHPLAARDRLRGWTWWEPSWSTAATASTPTCSRARVLTSTWWRSLRPRSGRWPWSAPAWASPFCPRAWCARATAWWCAPSPTPT